MRRLITPIFMLAVCLGGIGYMRGWFTVTPTPNAEKKTRYTVDVNPAKFNSDKAAFLRYATPIVSDLEKKLNDLIARSKQADPAAQPMLQQEIDDLTKQHQALQQDVKNLDSASPESFETSKTQVQQNIDNLQTGFKRTFGRVQNGGN